MTAVLSKNRMWLALSVTLVALVAVTTFVQHGQSQDQRLQLPFDFRSTAGTPTDKIVGSLQARVRENPRDFEAHLALADAYLQRTRETGDPSLYAKTQGLLDEAEKLNADSPELFAARGSLAFARHDFAGALEWGEKALVLDPKSARYQGIVGDAQIELGMYDEAIASYQEMIDAKPDFASFSRVAYARELYGDPEGAIQAMEFALQAGSGNPENVAWAQAQLGNLWFASGDLKEAGNAYDLSARTVDAYAPALAGRAKIAAARGDLDRAAALYGEAFDRMPLSEYAIARGDVYATMGDERKAEEQYEIVRSIDALMRENGVNTDMETALFYADQDLELRSSLDKARAAYEARPSIHAADVLAWTLYKSGEYEEAQRYSSEALKLGTRDPLKLYHAGMISKALGDNEQAREQLQNAVDLNPYFSVLYGDDARDELEALKAENE